MSDYPTLFVGSERTNRSDMSTVYPAAVRDLPPSRAVVWTALDEHGPLAVQEVSSMTGVDRWTARQALDDLRDTGLADMTPDPADARRRLWSTATE